MKKRVLVSFLVFASLLFAGEFDGKSSTDIIASTDSKNASSLANSAFEINKRAGDIYRETVDSCEKIGNLIKNELKGKTKEEKQKFMSEFRKAYTDKISALSSEEKAKFNDGICRKFGKFDKIRSLKDGKSKFRDANGTKMPPKPKFGKGDVEIPPMPKPKPEPKAQGGVTK